MGHLPLQSKLKGHLLCECQDNFIRTRHQATDVGLGENGRLLHVNTLDLKKGMSVRPRPTVVVAEASGQITSMPQPMSAGRETLQQ